MKRSQHNQDRPSVRLQVLCRCCRHHMAWIGLYIEEEPAPAMDYWGLADSSVYRAFPANGDEDTTMFLACTLCIKSGHEHDGQVGIPAGRARLAAMREAVLSGRADAPRVSEVLI